MANIYLLVYNAALVLGWGYCLYLTVDTMVVKKGSTEDLWKVVEVPLKVAQTAAVMEVLHSALGVVRSPVMITGMQVASRLWVVWGIINPAQRETTSGRVPLGSLPLPAWLPPQVAQAAGVAPGGVLPLSLSLATLLAAWSLTEVVRYGFFAIKELLPSPPYPLLWLRYTTFIPLYPLGVASELSMVWLAWPTLRRSHLWSVDMPNVYNFAFDYSLACLVIVAAYLPGLPQLYFYMLAQRKKVLSGSSGSKAAAGGTKKRQ